VRTRRLTHSSPRLTLLTQFRHESSGSRTFPAGIRPGKTIRRESGTIRSVGDRVLPEFGMGWPTVAAMMNVGMCFDRSLPAPFVVEVAEALDAAGVDQLWVIEDCFYTAGISLAATALARTERLTIGLGILPAVARNPAITAMELATLANLAPGRLLAGIGHGVQDWMEQMGARTASPLTTLDEVITVVRRLLVGDTVTFDGTEVTMRDVVLDAPPATVPPVLAGVRGPKSLALAGRVADGVVLAEGAGPTYVAQSLAVAGAPDPFRVSVFTALAIDDDAATARRAMAPFVAGLLDGVNPAPLAHPHIDEIVERHRAWGVDGIADMPGEWWIEFGAIGTFADAVRHAEALADAGADDVAFFPGPTVELVREDLDHVTRLAAALR
jgi:alkanesulfonate monooxygenase SsuD/methylene tetrahydromethanopterin reductase-like flavin-dependent oxidoreductase (luciferase family)